MYVLSPEAFHLHLFISFFIKTDQWLLVMSTQLIGLSIGGISNPILVAPSSMIWPHLLAVAAIFNTLHSQETAGTHASGGISRARFFTYFVVGYFLYSQLLFIYFPALEICPF
jgi:OPT oligopeptide transporter protein